MPNIHDGKRTYSTRTYKKASTQYYDMSSIRSQRVHLQVISFIACAKSRHPLNLRFVFYFVFGNFVYLSIYHPKSLYNIYYEYYIFCQGII